MKKEYMVPQIEAVNIKLNYTLLSGSPGAKDGCTTQDEFNENDVTFSSGWFDNGESDEDW